MALENENLRQRQLQDVNSAATPGGSRRADALTDEMINELNERVELLVGENTMLVEQTAILQQV